jgi:trk system potassium uptake protein TrkA
MGNWWHWQPAEGTARGGFAVIGVGRFGTAVCSELIKAGADVLAIDNDQKAVDALRQVDPAIQARVVDCTDEEALREAGVLDMETVVVAMSEPISASITATRNQENRIRIPGPYPRNPGNPMSKSAAVFRFGLCP